MQIDETNHPNSTILNTKMMLKMFLEWYIIDCRYHREAMGDKGIFSRIIKPWKGGISCINITWFKMIPLFVLIIINEIYYRSEEQSLYEGILNSNFLETIIGGLIIAKTVVSVIGIKPLIEENLKIARSLEDKERIYERIIFGTMAAAINTIGIILIILCATLIKNNNIYIDSIAIYAIMSLTLSTIAGSVSQVVITMVDEAKKLDDTLIDAERYYKISKRNLFYEDQLSKAEQGDSKSQFMIANMLINGENGVVVNIKEGLMWLAKSAESNNIEAIEQLASMYKLGYTTVRNYEEAKRLYTKGSQLGSAKCKRELAKFYYITEISKDYDIEKAKNLLEQAIRGGDVEAGVDMAEIILTQKNNISRDDLILAYAYLNIAARDSENNMETERKEIEKDLTYEEIEAAQKLSMIIQAISSDEYFSRMRDLKKWYDL